MNISKPFVLLLLCGLFTRVFSADLPKDLIKKSLKANAAYKNYEIEFTRSFKYPLEKDTLIETYQSTVYTISDVSYIGWHNIYYKRSGSPRSLIASNGSDLCRLNYKDQLHFCLNKLSSDKFTEQLKSHLYQPLLLTKEQLMLYKLNKETDAVWELIKTDTSKDAKGRVTLISKSTLAISKSNYLPVSEKTVTTSGTRVQYASYELIDIRSLEKSNLILEKLKADSFLNVIRQAPSGDSLKAARRDQYRKLKIGDTAFLFQATTYDGKAFDLNQLKDSIIVLDFFYTTCKPCINALPELNAIHRNLSASGLTVVGVNAFSSDWDNLKLFVSDHQIIYPVLKTGKEVLYEYGVTGFPRLIVVRNGIVVKVYFGYAKGMEQELQKLIDELNK